MLKLSMKSVLAFCSCSFVPWQLALVFPFPSYQRSSFSFASVAAWRVPVTRIGKYAYHPHP